MSSRKSNKSNSFSSESNTAEENTNQNSSKSFDSDGEFSVQFIEGNKFHFEVDISQHCIFEIGRVLSGKKTRYKVQKGWSASLNEIVWEQFKSDCSWSFKRADVVSKEVIVVAYVHLNNVMQSFV